MDDEGGGDWRGLVGIGGGIDWREEGLEGRRMEEWMMRKERIGGNNQRRVEECMIRVEAIGGKESGGMDDEGRGDWREEWWRNG